MDKVEAAVIVGVVDVDEDMVAIVTITIGNLRMCQNSKRGRILKRTTKVDSALSFKCFSTFDFMFISIILLN